MSRSSSAVFWSRRYERFFRRLATAEVFSGVATCLVSVGACLTINGVGSPVRANILSRGVEKNLTMAGMLDITGRPLNLPKAIARDAKAIGKPHKKKIKLNLKMLHIPRVSNPPAIINRNCLRVRPPISLSSTSINCGTLYCISTNLEVRNPKQIQNKHTKINQTDFRIIELKININSKVGLINFCVFIL